VEQLSNNQLDTICFYNGKTFGTLCGEHRKIWVNNFSFRPNVVNFEENVCKTFHGVIKLKYFIHVFNLSCFHVQ